MDDPTRQENEIFESEVRRIARELWPTAGGGAVIFDGREHDGVFETEECIHLIEATTSRRKDKAVEDVRKLTTLASKLQKRSPSKAVKCWFVTRDDPTADQRAVADKHTPLAAALSFSQFQSKLIDAKSYLAARDNYPFGSVRDPGTGDPSPKVKYIPLDLLDLRSRISMSVDQVLAALTDAQRLVLLGDYGIGKSMTLRHLFQELRKRHLRGDTPSFPVYLNLRDHFGQTDPAEILERHARIIGFPQPLHLVRVWRAGYVILFLDGFDEITTIGIQGLWKRLQENRFRAMEPVRQFVRQHPFNAGLALAGREHFFDTEGERHKGLGLRPGTIELSVAEFTDEQIRTYLEKTGLTGSIPDWLPSRPLLVGYLAAKGLLQSQGNEEGISGAPDPATGWDRLLEAVAEREAQIEAGIDGPTVRRILERLATKARSNEGGLGPLSADDIVSAFRDVCGYSPDDRGMVLLQRLPGLGIDRAEEETRAFIDEDFADACRAGDVAEFIARPYESISQFQIAECPLMTLGVSVAAKRSEGTSPKQLNAALRLANEALALVLASDLCRVAMERGVDVEEQIYIRGVLIPELECGESSGNCARLCFQDCFFTRVGIDLDVKPDALPRFQRCYIGELDGRLSLTDLPAGVFDDECVIEEFTAHGETTSEIMALSLPLGVRVLLTVLKKLYQRRGSGRKEGALFRGLDHRSKRLVGSVLRIVERQNLAVPYRRRDGVIWLPERAATKRVGRILASPTTVQDAAVREAGTLE